MPNSVNSAWELYKSLVLGSLKSKNQKTEIGRWKYHIEPILGKKPLEDLTSLDYLELRRSVEEKGLSPQTVKHCLSLLRRVLLRSYEWGIMMKEPPPFKNTLPKFDNRRMRFLSREEAILLLKTIQEKEQTNNWYEIVIFALNTGLRKGEIFNLSRNDINMESRFITVLDTKSNINRTIPLNTLSFKIIQNKMNNKESYHLFTNKNNRIFEKAVKEIGLNNGVKDLRHKVVFHTLRHTFASWLVQDGVPISLVSKLLGHSNIQMTMRYSHLAPQEGVTAVNGLASRFVSSSSFSLE